MPYFTQRLVDDFATHIRLYTRALEKAKVANKEGKLLIFFTIIKLHEKSGVLKQVPGGYMILICYLYTGKGTDIWSCQTF